MKCLLCKKKLNLVQTIHGKCRCEDIYCSKHLSNHCCNFDYKGMEQKKLLENNPQIIGKKISKI